MTKCELSETDDKLRISIDSNNQNIEESRKQHFRQMSTIAQLTEDLAKEVDEHALSENELRKLENRVESLTEQLRDALDCKEEIEHKNKTLREKLVDAEQEIKNSHRLTQSQHKELLRYEFKQAELATLDTAVLKVKVKDLENSIAGKERIIDLLKSSECSKCSECSKSSKCSKCSMCSECSK